LIFYGLYWIRVDAHPHDGAGLPSTGTVMEDLLICILSDVPPPFTFFGNDTGSGKK
jgi:hypothetical protein